jgi:hypothetical protein
MTGLHFREGTDFSTVSRSLVDPELHFMHVKRSEVKLPTRLHQTSRVRMRGALVLPPPPPPPPTQPTPSHPHPLWISSWQVIDLAEGQIRRFFISATEQCESIPPTHPVSYYCMAYYLDPDCAFVGLLFSAVSIPTCFTTQEACVMVLLFFLAVWKQLHLDHWWHVWSKIKVRAFYSLGTNIQ